MSAFGEIVEKHRVNRYTGLCSGLVGILFDVLTMCLRHSVAISSLRPELVRRSSEK